MKLNFDNPSIYLRFIRALSWLVPAPSRIDWRREWEAEIINRWQVLQKWNKLNMKSKLDLSAKVAGATRDVSTFQDNRMRLVLVTLNILVALALGVGAVQEFVIRGIRDQQLQPFLMSSVGIVVSVLFIVSAIAMLRDWPAVRRLVLITGVLSILLHVYGALPPHRNVGFPALLLGAGYALVMLLAYRWSTRRNLLA